MQKRLEHASKRLLPTAYPFPLPVVGIPNNVPSSLMVRTEDLRGHLLVLGKPNLEFPVPAPVTSMSRKQMVSILVVWTWAVRVQFLRRHLLLDISGTAVEYPE